MTALIIHFTLACQNAFFFVSVIVLALAFIQICDIIGIIGLNLTIMQSILSERTRT